MTHRTMRRKAALRHWRNFLGGSLIGTGVQAPVFAATEFLPADWHLNPGDWTARLQHGDLVVWLIVVAIALIVAGIAYGFWARDRTPKTPPPDAANSIGRHRPRVYY
jgi:hypothetical protein